MTCPIKAVGDAMCFMPVKMDDGVFQAQVVMEPTSSQGDTMDEIFSNSMCELVECAWWDKESNCCSVCTIATALRKLSKR